MADGKKTFIFYSDWINMVREMPNEHAGELLKHILGYVNDENPTTDNLFVKMAFGHMKPMLKRDLEKWDKQLVKFSEMGKKSAEKRKQNSTQVEPTLTQVKPTSTVNDNVNVNVNVNDNNNISKDINSRKAEFKNSLLPFLDEFGNDLLNEFFSYWSEHGERDRKMRFEKEKSFGISRRLATWLKNQKRFEKEKSSAKKEKGALKPSAGEIIQQIKQGTYNK